MMPCGSPSVPTRSNTGTSAGMAVNDVLAPINIGPGRWLLRARILVHSSADLLALQIFWQGSAVQLPLLAALDTTAGVDNVIDLFVTGDAGTIAIGTVVGTSGSVNAILKATHLGDA